MSINDPIEVTAATVQEALKQALAQLGAPEEDVTIEVLATPRAGVLGLGMRQAKIRVTRRPQLAATSGVQSPPPAPARPPQDSRAQQPKAQQPARPERRQERTEDRRTENRTEDRRDDRRGGRSQPPRSEGSQPGPQPRQRQDARQEPRADRERQHRADSDENSDAPRLSANLDQQAAEASEILVQILDLMGEKG
ncbi:MAG: Jag N-terminal domain-containing protein, partial [Candidatus Binataceae bacterium]